MIAGSGNWPPMRSSAANALSMTLAMTQVYRFLPGRHSSPDAPAGLEVKEQPRGTVHAEGLARLPQLVARSREVLDALEEIGQCDPRLEAREWRSKASVDARAKRDVRIGVARD